MDAIIDAFRPTRTMSSQALGSGGYVMARTSCSGRPRNCTKRCAAGLKATQRGKHHRSRTPLFAEGRKPVVPGGSSNGSAGKPPSQVQSLLRG